MKLLSLKGRNIGLLKGDFEFEFDDALTVITGPIGCGKSTILTMIRASLTNSFPGNAASWASWGTSPQEACYFVVSWRIGNKVLHIAKAVAGEKKFGTLNIPRLRIEHDDGKVEEVFGSKEALEKTHALIPVPANIIDGHLIVDQDSITAPVSATPAKFKEIIHTLTRTNEMEAMRHQVRDVLMTVTVPDVQGPLQEAVTENNLAQGEMNRLAGEIKEAERAYGLIDINAVNRKLETLELLKKNDELRTRLESQLTTGRNVYAQLGGQLKNQESSLLSLRAEHAAKAPEAEEAKKSLYSADALIANTKQRIVLQGKASKLAEALQECMASQPVAPTEERPAEGAETWVIDKLNETKQAHAIALRRLNLAKQGSCPECGTSTTLCEHDLTNLQVEVSNLSTDIDTLNETLNEVRKLNKAWVKFDADSKDYENCVETTMAKAAEVNQALEAMQDIPDMTPELKAEIAKVVSAFDILERNVASMENSISAVKGHLNSQQDMLNSIEQQLADIPPARYDDNEYARLTKSANDAAGLRDKITRLNGNFDMAVKAVERAAQKLEIQEKRAAAVKPIERFRSILDKVSTVLMKDGLPRIMSLQYMQKLNERLAFYLSTINADFTAYIDENLEFMAKKSDGLVHSAKRLSGGQKQQASVCYLLAVNDVFASTLGILALDEPSGAMQESNSRDLAEAFNYLAKMGQHTGRQFIVITHSNALAAYGCKQIALEGSE